MRAVWIGLCALVSFGCVDSNPPVTLTTPFDLSEFDWAMKDGTNTVSGFATLRTVGGEARTCAGLVAYLIPDSLYSRERLMTLYGSIVKGTRSADEPNAFANDNPSYGSVLRRTRCDGQGSFSFERIPDGTWYVATSVTWQVRPSSGIVEGGSMMRRVELRGGQTVKVALP